MSFQKNEEEVKLIKNKFYIKISLLILLHIVWLFLSNLLILILNEISFNNENFTFYGFLSVTVVIMTSLFFTFVSLKEETDKVIKRLINEKTQ